MKKFFRILLIVVLILAVIAAGLMYLGRTLSNNMKQSLSSNVERYQVARGDLSFTAVGSGKISSADVKTVSPDGTVTEVMVKVGDYVMKDDVLAEYTTLRGTKKNFKAEYEGVVTAIPGNFDAATAKAAGSSFDISSIEKLQMDIQITENEIFKIKLDQKASIYIDALELTVDGTVSRISQAGKTSGDFSVYDVTVTFDKTNEDIYLGMTGSARILIDTKTNIIKVPVDAIIEKNNKRYVLLSAWLDNVVKPQSDYYAEVKTGLSDSDFVEITEGDIDGREILILPEGESMSFRRPDFARD